MVRTASFIKFQCQICTSLWTTNYGKSRQNDVGKVHENPHAATSDIVQKLNIRHVTALNHLHSPGLVKKLDREGRMS